MSRTKSPLFANRVCLTFGIARDLFCRRGDPARSILLVLMREFRRRTSVPALMIRSTGLVHGLSAWLPGCREF